MSFTTLKVERAGRVAEIRMTRPDRGNPIDARFLDELDAAVQSLHDDAGVSAVLLTAGGDVFSSGRLAEPGEMAGARSLPFRSLETVCPPIIAVIEGDAVGAGLELALACDIRIAADEAMFALPDVSMGMTPSAGATARLPRIAGRGIAAEMILLGARIDGRRAQACGLVNEALPRPGVRPRAQQIAAEIAQQGPIAVRYAKEAIVRGLDMPLDQALRYETDLTVILQTTADRAEGVRAFLEKRPPRFEGR